MLWWHWVLLPLAGALAGFINAAAGAGSLITLPALMLGGLPVGVANGSNRVGILFQSVVSLTGFSRGGYGRFGRAWLLVLPALLFSILGAQVASNLSADVLNPIVGSILILMLLLLFLKPKRWMAEPHPIPKDVLRRPELWVGMVLIGFYGGFIQVGANYMILFLLVVRGGFDVMHANAFKLLVQFTFTVAALPIYIYHGLVHWPSALLMASGTVIGAWLGARTAVRRGVGFVRILLVVSVLLFAVKLLFF